MRAKSYLARLFVVGLMIISSEIIRAQQSIQASPTRFIAYSLYNFSKFIDWPSDAFTGTFQIAIVGDKNVFQELTDLAKNKKQGNAVYQISYFKNSTELTGTNNIIYLSNFYSGKVHDLSTKISTRGVLLVTEREGMSGQGSTICFVTADNGTMGFELSTANAIKNQLKVHEQLEKLAMKVN
jgi:hypothetical protein